jgi:ATP-binding cassette subfamily F protein uup
MVRTLALGPIPVLGARNLSKAYGTRTLFTGASLTISEGERVGLVGANGAGKSTLLRVLAGLEAPDGGSLDRRRDASILYLAQEPALDPDKTPREIVLGGLAEWNAARARHEELSQRVAMEGATPALLEAQSAAAEAVERLGGWERGHLVEEICGKLGVRELSRPVGTMSGGERRRVALAHLLVARPSLAILDEPTNHLDADTIEWLEQYLADEWQGAVLLVTHDRWVLDAICDRIVELEHGALVEYQGGWLGYLERKAQRLAHAERVERNRLNLLRRETAWLMRQPKARTTKQKARIQRAHALAQAEGPKALARVDLEGIGAGAAHLGKQVLDLKGVRVEVGGRTLVSELTLHMVGGDRVGIVGPNGAGKTSLLRVVTGELSPAKGSVVLGARTRLAVFDQARALLRDDWSVLDNVADREGAERTGAGVVTLGERTLDLLEYLQLFLFEGPDLRKRVGALSGGERARVALAKVLRSGANLLLLDEPTNDLDVATLSSLEELLSSWPGCALIVSHDRWFLDRVATSILAFEGDGRVVRYPGGYTQYRALRDEAEANAARNTDPAKVSPRPPTPPPEPRRDAGTKPLTHAERIELDGMMVAIEGAEARVAKAQSALADPSLYASRAKDVPAARAELEAAEAELARLMRRWESLEARKDAKRK